MKRILLLVTGAIAVSCGNRSTEKMSFGEERQREPLQHVNYYIGDIHNHCNVTYGHGDLSDAITAAKGQLDFATVTPHALWPDIPGRDDPRLSWVIDYHTGAFEKLRKGGWEIYKQQMAESNDPGKFVSFLSYECHSMEHGDHVALLYDLDAPLLECTSIPDLKQRLSSQKAFLTPHHMGYIMGYRGYNWKAHEDDAQMPFVEILSRHGLAESDQGDWNYLHDMGPRTYEGSAEYGWEQGYVFGVIGSTDQHAGYPGSYGDGRIIVLADSLDRESLWNAMQNRRVYAVSGDKIKIDFRINDALMGDIIQGNKRDIYLNVEGCDFIDYIDIIKNNTRFARICPGYSADIPAGETVRAKVKVEFGWNREEEYVHWLGDLSITDGMINDVQPCFRGAAYTSPQPGEHAFKTHPNRITGRTDRSVGLDLYSTKNPNVLTPAMQGVILDVTMPKSARIVARVNGQEIGYTLAELLEGSKANFMRGWLSEAVLFNRAATPDVFTVDYSNTDDRPSRDTDYYYVRVRQRDGQWAWSTPIWVKRQ